jgi:hypothetical protein
VYTTINMKKITGVFVGLVLIIIFFSIIYIWQAEAEKKQLESDLSQAQQEIIQLEKNLGQNGDDQNRPKAPSAENSDEDLESSPAQNNSLNSEGQSQSSSSDSTGEVQGTTISSIGEVSGVIYISSNSSTDKLLVCATNTRSNQDHCIDQFNVTKFNNYDYNLEIPRGEYLIYTQLHPESKKVYYSNLLECNDKSVCKTTGKAQPIKIVPLEPQANIDIYL